MEERERIALLKTQGFSLREIGKVLGRSHSTLSRELRNKRKYGVEYFGNEYLPCKAQELADKRERKQRTKAPLKKPLIFVFVRENLRSGLTPEEISGRLPLIHPGESISTECIYSYIYGKGKRYKLWRYLVNGRKKRMKKLGRRVRRGSKIPNATSIEQRPGIVSQRGRVGDWETDNVIGKQTDKLALSVTVERLTRFTKLSLVKRSASSKCQSLIKDLSGLPQRATLTLTCDNGAENTNHQILKENLSLEVFFCHSYASWEKGTVENTNGRIRRYIPKGLSLDTLTKEYVKALEYKLNSTPRKCLGYLTPYERMNQLLSGALQH